ncbi:MAG: IclR family transcriptional regulator C-terminal domain-containing protein [Phenylobacterium sp.]|nr:IclR family transcriptional regulator C-terminal domain-containing protein [Phenylobacterium sp.]
MEQESGAWIRSISRSLAVLRVVNRAGALSMGEISQAARVPYPTACRIVQTLVLEGMLEREPGRKRYRPTVLVKSLSHGYQDHSGLTDLARPHIVELTREQLWPVSLCTRVGQMMIVRDCTHAISPMALSNYYPGATFPLLECASGHVYLAYADAEEREQLLEGAEASEFEIDPLTLRLFASGSMAADIRAEGYAARGRNLFTNTPGRTSSIAAPIFRDGRVCAALTMVYFAGAMTMREAADRYAPGLCAAAARISDELSRSEVAQYAA